MKLTLNRVVPAPLAGTFSFHPLWEQDEVSFDSDKTYLIKAESGKGKSTLLHLLYGLRHDYSGNLKLDQKDYMGIQAPEWASLRTSILSMVFQELRLFPQLTGWENIQIKANLSPSKYPLEEWAERLAIHQHLDKPAGQLSYGQQQRLAIIRALAQPFQFLLMDEPFSHLDDNNISNACELIEEVRKQNNAGLILSSLGPDYPIQFEEELSI